MFYLFGTDQNVHDCTYKLKREHTHTFHTHVFILYELYILSPNPNVTLAFNTSQQKTFCILF